MIQRVLSGWSFVRVLYLVMGCFVIAQSLMDRQWMGVVLGIYVAAMGLLGFGCASGKCYPSPSIGRKRESKAQDIEFEEVKTK